VSWRKAVLAAEFVEARDAVFAVADDVEGGEIDLFGGAVEARQGDVLHELGMVVQGEQAEALAAEAESPSWPCRRCAWRLWLCPRRC
jgi:hypothetical protein